MSENVKEVFRKIRFISELVLVALVALTGLMYAVYTDLKLGNTSSWLFFAVITTIGSAALMILSESFKEKKVLCIGLKIGALLLLILFLVVLFFYKNAYINLQIAEATKNLTDASVIASKTAQATEAAKKSVQGILIISIILAIFSIIAEGLHLTSSIITIDDDK